MGVTRRAHDGRRGDAKGSGSALATSEFVSACSPQYDRSVDTFQDAFTGEYSILDDHSTIILHARVLR